MPQRRTLLWATRTNMTVGVVVVGLCSLDSARPCSAPNSGPSPTLLTALLVALLAALLCCRTNQIWTGPQNLANTNVNTSQHSGALLGEAQPASHQTGSRLKTLLNPL